MHHATVGGRSPTGFVCISTHFFKNDINFLIYSAAAESDIFGPFGYVQEILRRSAFRTYHSFLFAWFSYEGLLITEIISILQSN